MTDTKFRYYQCEGLAFELLTEYGAQLNELNKERDDLQAEYNEKHKEMIERQHAILRTKWRKLSGVMGLDPDVTWGNPEYQIETRFIAAGFGAVIHTPSDQTALQKMLAGGEGADVSKDEEDPLMAMVPEGSLLN